MYGFLTILLAEDEKEEKTFFQQGLHKLNLPHKILWAKDHTEVFELLEKEPGIDLVIIDLNMPGKNGKQCIKDIKADEKYKKLPVIVMTVSKHMEDINDAFEAGAHYYAIKPYSHTNYIETLRQIFSINWKVVQPVPEKKDFIINLAFA